MVVPVVRSSLPTAAGHLCHGEAEQFGSVHINVVRAAPVALRVSNRAAAGHPVPHAACGYSQVCRTPPVGAIHKWAKALIGTVGAADQSGRCRIAKDGAHALVGAVDELAVSLGCDQQNPACLPRFDQAFGKTQTVDEARATEIEIERASVGRNAESVLNNARRGWKEVVRALRAEEQEVDFRGADSTRCEQFPGGRDPEIGRTLGVARNVTLPDADLVFDLRDGPFGEFSGQLLG